MRLSYCYPTPERIHEGVRRLAGVINDELELRTTFGATVPTLSRGYEGPNTDLT
jgi:2-aminoadipate transaminase